MARANAALIQAIRRTAEKLKKGNDYMWGHMGSCNCGNLAQEITQLTRASIHAYAMRGHGDWADQINDFCPTSGMPMDLLISEMLSAGLDREDLIHLERLSDQEVLSKLPLTERNLRHNYRDDVVKYLTTWASALEDELVEKVNISDATEPAEKVLSLL
ncbi:MAG: hypothetical protein RIE86_00145 [Imperialibacter sp.]|jgi:hypothetical protein|uniref:hypothetical protein n=1 Tax=Imperialibacter sp. TaxID=2038411 RepID=UPI0032EEA469